MVDTSPDTVDQSQLPSVTAEPTESNDELQDAWGDGASDLSQPEPPKVNLTTLKDVSVTSVWPTEAHHFTPWLLQNSGLLSEALGVDVELESREYKVGKFSLDIIGRDVNTGAAVIIENQYGPTDHLHLGQILTYVGGTKPSTIIWIAEHFREEHRAALEWLNAHTDTHIRFFGIKLAAVTLDGAPPGLIAPSLELVVKPNDWEKTASAQSAATTNTTRTQELYRQFWSKFEPLAKQRGWSNASAPAQNWWTMPTGVSGANWTVSYAQFGCRSELYFGHPDTEVNLSRWNVLNDQKDAIVEAFGGELVFDELPNNKGCRIEARRDGPKIADQSNWGDVLDWMIDTQERLGTAISAAGGVPSITSDAR